jgi:cell fate (sporulation/competence/biofilm development) regulator YlbF (YheA/YmcA/DUF963 family)
VSHKAWDTWSSFIEDTQDTYQWLSPSNVTFSSLLRRDRKIKEDQVPKTKFTSTVKLRRDFPAVQSCGDEETRKLVEFE